MRKAILFFWGKTLGDTELIGLRGLSLTGVWKVKGGRLESGGWEAGVWKMEAGRLLDAGGCSRGCSGGWKVGG